ncbi:tripartite tricarboxylate transporter substrate binding protein [Roseomonas sp. KE2513]|uniref:Bug family tripartite tricarboxylate transporter substrate binding protein n=1 Tax=Roseomonas sp. KE2513 TaxID=2479202 RepID=UPI0018DFB19A|nr:tripartite tricarboxylate transporter substrate binding protein [Roseomonas sp. KE2513]MBI0538016.1 tripartite tricarboxylate transporter substrate binding protein [Roseomonas sp. KE2513]
MNRRTLLGATFAAAPLLRAASAWAEFPGRAPRLIVPYPPGGITDLVARKIADGLGALWERGVVVDNRPGAGGNMAAAMVARAAPDGNTLYIGFAGTHAMNVSLYRKLDYDPVADFAPISLLIESPLALTLHPSVPATNLAELTAYARANPGKLAFGSSGNGGASHRALEIYKSLAGVDILHVPYRGAAQSNTDLLGGKIQGMFDTLITATPNIRAGGVRALAVTGRNRAALLPELPTMEEAGLPGCVFLTWLGLLSPAGLTPDLRNRLNRDTRAVLAGEGMRRWCAENGLEPAPSSPEEFAVYMAEETRRFAAFVRETGMSVE